MSDAGTPEGQKSVEELKAELEEVGDEIAEAKRDFAAEHPHHPTFIEGEDAEGEES